VEGQNDVENSELVTRNGESYADENRMEYNAKLKDKNCRQPER